MVRAGLSGGTEAALCPAMEYQLTTNVINKKIFKVNCPPLCQLCQQKDKMVCDIVSACPKLAGTKYTKCHDNIV
eukprot:9083483-Ditylum_brightwellii.AAC.1